MKKRYEINIWKKCSNLGIQLTVPDNLFAKNILRHIENLIEKSKYNSYDS